MIEDGVVVRGYLGWRSVERRKRRRLAHRVVPTACSITLSELHSHVLTLPRRSVLIVASQVGRGLPSALRGHLCRLLDAEEVSVIELHT
jgi:hypothetical protein